MLADSKEKLPLVKKGRLLEKDIILLHYTYSKVTCREDIRALGDFSFRLAGRLRELKVCTGVGPTLKTVATPIGDPSNAVEMYRNHYEGILVFITTHHNFTEEVFGKHSDYLQLSNGPALHITVSELNNEVFEDVWEEIDVLIDKMFF